MTNQFIAHAEQPRTFADKKGATKAIKRDLDKHWTTHGDVLYETGFDVKPTGDRFGVVVYVDLTPDAAAKLVGPELAGYVIEPQLNSEPAPKSADKPAAPKKQPGKRKTGEVNVAPMDKPIPARANSKQQAMIDLLARDCVWDQRVVYYSDPDEKIVSSVGMASLVGGCTMDDLRAVCVKKDGTPWDDNSIRSGLYYDVHQKGYGVSTRIVDDVAHYMLVLPEGYDAPLEARTPKT
ncbi:MAG TPA: hypothetical protein VIG24_11370 [Acidimicrobiia bacterium]